AGAVWPGTGVGGGGRAGAEAADVRRADAPGLAKLGNGLDDRLAEIVPRRRHFEDTQGPAGLPADDVGEGAADIDSDLETGPVCCPRHVACVSRLSAPAHIPIAPPSC